jgi:hypothetical protein
MDYEKLLGLTYDYNRRLDEFIAEQELPYTWFDEGIDHVAVKAYHPEDYQGIVARFRPVSEKIVETNMQDRWIATARLMGKFAIRTSLSVSDWVYVKDVEIMLARPEDQGNKPPEFDHSEIYVPDKMIPINRVLERNRLRPQRERNDAHEWISITFGEQADEVKFTDTRLSEINERGILSGRAKVLYEKRPKQAGAG